MRRRIGLALYAVLLLGSLITVLVIVTVSCLIPEGRSAQMATRGRLLKIGAEQAARMAVAELQGELGRDQMATYLEVQGGLGLASAAFLDFKRQSMSGETTEGALRWSWKKADLSLEYDELAAFASIVGASGWAKSSSGRQKLPVGPLDRVLSPLERRALEMGDRVQFESHASPHVGLGPGWGHFGLLTNPAQGGFKVDLGDPVKLKMEFGKEIAEVLGDHSMRRMPSEGQDLLKAKSAGRRLVHLPVLVDFRLSLGFFNSRSDGRHRLRFHCSGMWWNPSSTPVLANTQNRLFLAELTGAPEVTVSNLDSGASFTMSLDEAPLLDLGLLEQTPRESTLWFWADIADKSRHGMLARGLLPGETFGFVAPSGQPQGLARILTAQTWKYDDDYHGPSWKRPNPQTFRPDDRIQISVRFRDRMAIYLRPAGPDPDKNQLIADYPVRPAYWIEGIPFPDFQILTNGRDYTREDSKGYVIRERRACLRLRLRPRSPVEFISAAVRSDLSRVEWDLRNEAENGEWVIDNPLTAALDTTDIPVGPGEGMPWDVNTDAHDADLPGAFAGVRVRDLPLEPRVSVGTFRHLEGRGGRLWVPLLDRAFVSAPLNKPEPGVVSHNPRLVDLGTAGMTQADMGADSSSPASQQVVRGAFNVNSRSADAWKALLGRSEFAWKADTGGPFAASVIQGTPYFTLPSGAGTAQWGVARPTNLPDSVLRGLSSERLIALSGSQAVRELGQEMIEKLADKIVELQPTHAWPYASLQTFAESGLLRDAIRESGLNAFLPEAAKDSALCLEEGDLLEAFAPMLTVRGDTFRIIARAEPIDGRGGYAELEVVVQRTPAMHGLPWLGRRFRVVSAKVRP